MGWRPLALGFGTFWVAACASILGIDDGIPRGADGGDGAPLPEAHVDVQPEAQPACDPSAPFGTPVALSSLAAMAFQAQPRLLPAELAVYFERTVVDAGNDLLTAQRAQADAAFGMATSIPELDTPSNEEDPTLSPDGLRIFFTSDRPGGLGAYDIWQASRNATTDAFSTIALTANVSSTQDERHTYYVPGALYFASSRTSSYHIYRAAEQSGGFASPLLVAELSSSGFDYCPVVTTDELRIYFASDRGSDAGANQVWTSVRSSTAQPWPTPTPVSELDAFGSVIPSWISDDGCRLYISSDHSGTWDMYVTSK
jgi:Tol biopolymer transport system component